MENPFELILEKLDRIEKAIHNLITLETYLMLIKL